MEGLTVSLHSVNYPENYVRHCNYRCRIDKKESSDVYKLDSTFRIVKGLADPTCVSFESVNFPGYLLRHREDGQVYIDRFDGSDLNRKDATFYVRKGLANPNYNSFESYNSPGHFLRHKNWELFNDNFDGSELNRLDATFAIAQANVTA